jgi:hypothetical protein
MNLKNQRWRNCVIGAALLFVVGIVVFRLLHFWAESVIIRNVPREELPKIQAGVRDWRLKKVMRALQTREWRKLPALLADCLGRPVAEVKLLQHGDILAVSKSKNMDSHGICYFLMKTNRNWKVVGEIPPGLMPFANVLAVPPSVDASQEK